MNKKTKTLADVNEMEEKKIWEASQEIYTDIIVYLRVSRLSEYNQELVRRDIISMILEGQERDEGIRMVIGDDYQGFCDEIISAFPPKDLKEKVLEAFDMICMCLYILGTISVIFNLIDNLRQKNQLLTYSLSAADVLNFIMIVIIANLIVYLICKGAFQEEKKESRVRLFIKGALAFSLIVGFFVGTNLLFDVYAVRFHMIIAIACIALAYGVHKAFEARNPA